MSNENQYHFVVKFDAKDYTFEVDYETQEDVFQDGWVYDPTTDSWSFPTSNMVEQDQSLYNIVADAIREAVVHLKPVDNYGGDTIFVNRKGK
jgi:hypothetical protein